MEQLQWLIAHFDYTEKIYHQNIEKVHFAISVNERLQLVKALRERTAEMEEERKKFEEENERMKKKLTAAEKFALARAAEKEKILLEQV